MFRLMVEALGDREALVAMLERKGGAAHFLPPWGWILPLSWRWPLGEIFVYRCERGVFQYVLLRVVCAVISLVSEWGDALCEGWSHFPTCVAPWLNCIVLASQSLAMYCLFMFFHELMAELKPFSALSKLLAVKAVVFLSFLQSIFLSGLIYAGVLTATNSFDVTTLSASLQNFLIVRLFFAHRFRCSLLCFFFFFFFLPHSGFPPLSLQTRSAGRCALLLSFTTSFSPGVILNRASSLPHLAAGLRHPRR